MRNLTGHLHGISKGTMYLLAFTDIYGTFTVAIRNYTGHRYRTSKGAQHVLDFTDI